MDYPSDEMLDLRVCDALSLLMQRIQREGAPHDVISHVLQLEDGRSVAVDVVVDVWESE